MAKPIPSPASSQLLVASSRRVARSCLPAETALGMTYLTWQSIARRAPSLDGRVVQAASLHVQWRCERSGCDTTTRRANQQKPVQPFAQKYSASVVGQITGLTLPVSP